MNFDLKRVFRNIGSIINTLKLNFWKVRQLKIMNYFKWG